MNIVEVDLTTINKASDETGLIAIRYAGFTGGQACFSKQALLLVTMMFPRKTEGENWFYV